MTPAPGRIVLVFADPHHNNGADTAPAVVTRAWSGSVINVRVLHDAPARAGGQLRHDWLTSVPLFDTREEAETAHEAAWAHIPPETRPGPFAAFWPPRVP